MIDAIKEKKDRSTLFAERLRWLRHATYFMELYLLYFIVVLRLRRQGLKKAVARCTTLHRLDRACSEAQEREWVMLTRDLTRKVLQWHVVPNSCVPGSLLPCWFLARRGIKVDFVIVIRQYPFMAHAQAYWRDMLLTERPPAWSVPSTYITLMRK